MMKIYLVKILTSFADLVKKKSILSGLTLEKSETVFIKKLKNVDSGKPTTERVFIDENITKRNKHLFYLANERRKRFGWKYIWTNNGRIHLIQNNDSKAITIRNDKDFEQIKKPTVRTGNLSRASAFAYSVCELTNEIPVSSFWYGEWSTYCPYICLVWHTWFNNALNQ